MSPEPNDPSRSPASRCPTSTSPSSSRCRPLDDYMIHQTPDPIRVMWSGDPRAYERYWMVCHDPTR